MSFPIHLVRHGQSQWNLERRVQGQSMHVPLTPLGEQQAKDAALLLADSGARVVYTSDLRRAVQTAEHIAVQLAAALILDPDLRERSLGEYEGQRCDDAFAAAGTAWEEPGWRPPGGESLHDVRIRVQRFLDRLRRDADGSPVVVVTHGETAGIVLALLRGTALGQLPPAALATLANGEVMTVPSEPGTGAWRPAYSEDPYPFFAEPDVATPLSQGVLEGVPVWLVTRYDDVRRLLADTSVSSDPLLAGPATRAVPWVQQADNPHPLVRSMVRVDPPEHTRLRKLVTKAFAPRRVEALRPRVEQIVGHLLDTMAPRGHADLIGDFALPLPFTIISELLGVPRDSRDEFAYWSNIFVGVDEDDFAHRPQALRYLTGFLETLIEHKLTRRAAATEDGDVLDVAIAARNKGDRLSARELLSIAFLLLAAGYETTASLIGNGMLALLYHPAQLAALRADPGMIEAAVEEFLRYDSPVKIAPALRFTTAEVRVAGTVIPPGETLLLFLSAANRDPGRFRCPDMLDVGRDAGGHMAFGHGVHYCLGAPLARIQGQAAFTALITRLDGLALGPGGPAWRYSFQLHSMKSLPVTFTAAR